MGISELLFFESNNFHITNFNTAAAANLGYTKGELFQMQAADLYPDFAVNELHHLLLPLLGNTRDEVALCTLYRRKDGSTYPAEVYFQYIEYASLAYILATSFDQTRDKTEIVSFKQKRESAKKLALDAKFRSEFLVNITHELRTALNSIHLLSKVLSENREGNLTRDQQEYSQVIHDSTRDLLQMTSEFLDHSKMEAGKMHLQVEPVNLQAACTSMERLYRPVARDKGLNFSGRLSSELEQDYTLHTDPLRLKQILKNLLSNAFKFTHEGQVKLLIYAPASDELKERNLDFSSGIAFQVSDTGIGISPDKQELIFESFNQARSATAQTYGGTGLGLTICKQITDLLGGELTLESEPGQGSTFTLYLPDKSSDRLNESSWSYVIKSDASEKVQEVQVQKKKLQGTILLVDDSYMHRLALQEYLEPAAKKLLTAGSAAETYEIVNKQQIDCMVLDMFLPDADGYEVMRRIKKQDNLQDTNILLYTGKIMSPEEEQELKKFADSIIYKKAESHKALVREIGELLPG